MFAHNRESSVNKNVQSRTRNETELNVEERMNRCLMCARPRLAIASFSRAMLHYGEVEESTSWSCMFYDSFDGRVHKAKMIFEWNLIWAGQNMRWQKLNNWWNQSSLNPVNHTFASSSNMLNFYSLFDFKHFFFFSFALLLLLLVFDFQTLRFASLCWIDFNCDVALRLSSTDNSRCSPCVQHLASAFHSIVNHYNVLFGFNSSSIVGWRQKWSKAKITATV